MSTQICTTGGGTKSGFESDTTRLMSDISSFTKTSPKTSTSKLPSFKYMDFAKMICNPGSVIIENKYINSKSKTIKNLKKSKFV